MLIVEGADLVGKTTLCHALVREARDRGVPAIYGHFGLLPDSWDYFGDYLQFVNCNAVMDRFVLSEIAYGTVARGRSFVDPENLRLIEGHLRLAGAVTVILVSLESNLKERWKLSPKHEHFTLDDILAVNRAFELMADDAYSHRGYSWKPDRDFFFRSADEMPAENFEFIRDIVTLWKVRRDNAIRAKDGRVPAHRRTAELALDVQARELRGAGHRP